MNGAGTARLRMDLAYDGTGFHGWAVQPGLRTIAGVLSDALNTLLRGPVPLVVAGRTDAGVHAAGQVAHIDVDPVALAALAPRRGREPADPAVDGDPGTSASLSGPEVPGLSDPGWATVQRAGLSGLRRRLAGLLPRDVRVIAVRAAPPGFDARFSALRRHYRYRVGTADWGVAPLRRREVLHWPRRLDIAAMNEAAAALTGLHDFAAFCKPREGATTIRDLQRLSVSEIGEEIDIDVSADAFCHSMVRSLVGALLAVGEKRVAEDWPARLLAAGTRTAALHVAPAHGLTLLGVDYPPDADLAARAGRTRARRVR